MTLTAADIKIIDSEEETPVTSDATIETVEGEETHEETEEGQEQGQQVPESEVQHQPAQETAVDFDQILSERTSGRFKNFQELDALLSDVDNPKPVEPTFENEAQKKVYDFVKKYGDGTQQDKINEYFKIQAIDLERADDKTILREKFLLDHPDLSREKGTKIFEFQYNKDYPEDLMEDEEENIGLKYQLEQAVKIAKTEIGNLQKEHQEALSNTPEKQDTAQRNELNATLLKEFEKFNGVKFGLETGDNIAIQMSGDIKPDNLINISLDKADSEEFKNIVLNPEQFYQTLFADEKGDFSAQKYQETLFFLKNKNAIMNAVAEKAYDRGQRSQVEKQKGVEKTPKSQGKQNATGSSFLQGIRAAKANQ